MKKLNKKGFTLAELLIVVAIIAVLVAISIPIFTAQLNKAKYAADEANARSIYSEMVADYLANGGEQKLKLNNDTSDVTINDKGSVTVNYVDGASNKYNFSGIVTIKFELGKTSSYPKVTLSACDKVGASEVIFGEGTVGSGQ